MTKICEVKDCNTEISAWQSLCPVHYAQQMQAGQQPQAEQPPVQQPVEQPKQQPKQKPVTEKVEEQYVQLPQRDALIVRQVAFKSAVQLIISLEDTSQKEYEQIVGETETLTDEFYKLILRGIK